MYDNEYPRDFIFHVGSATAWPINPQFANIEKIEFDPDLKGMIRDCISHVGEGGTMRRYPVPGGELILFMTINLPEGGKSIRHYCAVRLMFKPATKNRETGNCWCNLFRPDKSYFDSKWRSNDTGNVPPAMQKVWEGIAETLPGIVEETVPGWEK